MILFCALHQRGAEQSDTNKHGGPEHGRKREGRNQGDGATLSTDVGRGVSARASRGPGDQNAETVQDRFYILTELRGKL